MNFLRGKLVQRLNSDATADNNVKEDLVIGYNIAVIAFMSTMIITIHQIAAMTVVYRRRIGDGAGHLSIG